MLCLGVCVCKPVSLGIVLVVHEFFVFNISRRRPQLATGVSEAKEAHGY